MSTFLLILGILLIFLTIASSGLSLLYLYSYNHTMDGYAELYQAQWRLFITFAIIAVICLILTILCFRYRNHH